MAFEHGLTRALGVSRITFVLRRVAATLTSLLLHIACWEIWRALPQARRWRFAVVYYLFYVDLLLTDKRLDLDAEANTTGARGGTGVCRRRQPDCVGSR